MAPDASSTDCQLSLDPTENGILHIDEQKMIVTLYADDLVVFAENAQDIGKFKYIMSHTFKLKRIGWPTAHLALNWTTEPCVLLITPTMIRNQSPVRHRNGSLKTSPISYAKACNDVE